jgi:hypothetical protein
MALGLGVTDPPSEVVRYATQLSRHRIGERFEVRARSSICGVHRCSRSSTELALIPKSDSRHRLAAGALVLAKSVLRGLHHEYCLATERASA